MIKLDHLALPVTDCAKSRDWYVQFPLRGLDPRIDALPSRSGTTWMAGSSPATGNQGCTAPEK